MAEKILMVDDDPLVHQLYQRHIEQAGFEMVGATNGRKGLEVATRELPQLIVMDMVMPEMDGIRAIMELKRNTLTQAIPVIAISAEPGFYHSQQQLHAVGAALLLTKPFGARQLLDAIARLISGPRPNAATAS